MILFCLWLSIVVHRTCVNIRNWSIIVKNTLTNRFLFQFFKSILPEHFNLCIIYITNHHAPPLYIFSFTTNFFWPFSILDCPFSATQPKDNLFCSQQQNVCISVSLSLYLWWLFELNWKWERIKDQLLKRKDKKNMTIWI